jgi:hypothetical protein
MERPDDAFFESQLRHVIDYAEIRTDRASEIVVQMHPQVPFWSAAVHIHPAHTPKTLEMIELALGFASIICMRFKQAMAVARPIDWSTDIQPIIATPSHSAYPSGHATEAFMIAYALPKILTNDASAQSAYQTQLERQAHRIAENRTVAGVHFPVDSGAGQILAKVLADYFLFSCFGDHAVAARSFEPSDKHADFDPVANLEACKPISTLKLPVAQPETSPLHWLAERARREFE